MQTLYNGIQLPDAWPPRDMPEVSGDALPVPYLAAPPALIRIDRHRQLFVDDFLIDGTTMERHFYTARWLEENPVLQPETPLEMGDGLAPCAAPFNDGCWFDGVQYRLYYHAGWMNGTALAVSDDGVHWVRKYADVQPGTNRVLLPTSGWRRDGAVIWLDREAAAPEERYKAFHFFRTPEGEHAEVAISADGIHFSAGTRTGPCGDNSSIFYNPFRKKWVYSIRANAQLPDGRYVRARRYFECDDLIAGAAFHTEDTVFWQRCDDMDRLLCEPGIQFPQAYPPQLYDLNCAAYESVMLGMFAILKGFDECDNDICLRTGQPKHIDLHLGYSRDGFHFARPERAAFLRGTGVEGDWNRGYLHATGGLFLRRGDELLFPIGGFSAQSPKLGKYLYAGASTGIAVLRRDGFASMNARYSAKSLTTRALVFSQGDALFVNANAREGFLRAEILDAQGHAIPGFSLDDCLSAQADGCAQILRFRGGSLAPLRDTPIRIRFQALNCALYAFWVAEAHS